MRAFLLTLILLLPLGAAQSVWLETGLAYAQDTAGAYTPGFRLGVRGVYPLTDTVGLYSALGIGNGFLVDAGAWFSFAPGVADPSGFNAFIGTGLTLAGGRFGIALTGAATYELTPELSIGLVYTHRPLFLPELGQAFDVSLALRYNLDPSPLTPIGSQP